MLGVKGVPFKALRRIRGVDCDKIGTPGNDDCSQWNKKRLQRRKGLMNPVNMQDYFQRTLFEPDYIQPYFPTSMPYYLPQQLMYDQPALSTQPKSPNALSSTPPAPTKQIHQPFYDPSLEQPLEMPAYWPETGDWSQLIQPNSVFTPPMFGMNPPKRVFSFVSMTHSKTKKRHRRRYDEIDRVYKCCHLNCTKSYGTLNNLNAHILMQSHGPKRSAFEFKDLATRRSSDALQPL